LLSLAATAPPPAAQTYYVRTDGGSAEQCDGRHDAAYAGSGRHKACAWRHPFEALPPGGPARIAAGDTLLIASGAYMMGRGAAGTQNLEKCRADWPWDCHVAPLPSGAARDRPTRILGAGWDHGCANPPQLWGTERAANVLDLQGSSNVEIACLEITDHSSCIEFHAGARQVEACERDKEPYGQWAGVGIAAADSSHVTISDVLVHGMAHDGFRVGRVLECAPGRWNNAPVVFVYRWSRDGKPINNAKYMCNSTLIAIMGRMCTYTGQELTWDKFISSTERLGPERYAWGDVPEPTVAIPGKTKFA